MSSDLARATCPGPPQAAPFRDMRCARCATSNAVDARFCVECGNALGGSCPACRAPTPAGSRFCAQCGAPVPGSAEGASGGGSSGERRQLTVLFCDLVGSTALGERFDPETLRELIAAYQSVCERAVEGFGGHIAQYLGDGVLVYFGYPTAYEDAAERAVRAALAIQEGLRDPGPRIAELDVVLEARIGIHTGEVVIGDVGGTARTERLALGGTPNIASRLQRVAEPGRVVISEATQRLTSGIFVIEHLGARELEGVDQPLQAFRVLRASGVPDRLGAARQLTRLVGRDEEIAQLEACWRRTVAGEGQVVRIRGDPGIGKSRLIAAFRERIADVPHTLLSAACASYASGSGFAPLVRMIAGELDLDAAEDPTALLAAALEFPGLDPQKVVPFVAHLLGLPPSDAFPLLPMSPELQRHHTLEALVAIPEAVCALQPVLFVFEDLHWSDPSTLAFLELLAERIPRLRILLLVTQRPDPGPTAALEGPASTTIDLAPLLGEQIVALVREAAGRDLLPEVEGELASRAGGVPLYAEELTRSFVNSGVLESLRGADPNAQLQQLAIPSTLQDSLMARLDRLGGPKAVAQLAAVLGRDFDAELLTRVAGADAAALGRDLDALASAGVIRRHERQRGGSFGFTHALIHDAAYRSQLRADRRRLHARIVEIVEAEFPERAETQPDHMILHALGAELDERIVHYAERAAERERDRLAHEEAATFYDTAIEHLQKLEPGASRDAREVQLALARGIALGRARGQSTPEVFEAYAHVRRVNDRLPKGPLQLPGWIGLAQHVTITSTFPQLAEVGGQILELSEPLGVPALQALGHLLCGSAAVFDQPAEVSIRHLEKAVRLAESQPGGPTSAADPDLEVAARSTLMCSYLVPGELDRFQESERLVLERARKLDHAATLGMALTMASAAAWVLRDAERTLLLSDEARRLARERGFVAWQWQNELRHAWARLELGQEVSEAELGAIWDPLVEAGAHSTYAVQQLAYAQALAGQGAFGRALVQCGEAHATMRRNGELTMFSTVHFHRGVIFARSGHVERAIEELRRATKADNAIDGFFGGYELARLLIARGETDAARRALDEGLAHVRGGDALPGVRAARALRAELGAAGAEPASAPSEAAPRAPARSASPAGDPPRLAEGVDWSLLLEQVGGDPAIAREVADAYAAETRHSLKRLPSRIDAGDAAEVRRQAHTVKGAMRLLRAGEAFACAQALEQRAASGDLAEAARLLAPLLEAVEPVLLAVDRFVAGGGED